MLYRQAIEFGPNARFNARGASTFRQHYGQLANVQPSLLARIIAWLLA